VNARAFELCNRRIILCRKRVCIAEAGPVVRLNTRRRLCPASENVMRRVNPERTSDEMKHELDVVTSLRLRWVGELNNSLRSDTSRNVRA